NVISIFESWWFNYEILKKNPSSSYEKINKSSSSSCSEPKYSSLRSILKQEEVQVKVQNEEVEKPERRKKKIRRQGTSKSLSELEFKEVKGFMDLGFVFSEKDQDPSLAEIIPGLQRLSKDVTTVRRPYLSEAWEEEEDLHNKKLNKRIMDPKTTLMMINWEVPCVKDENELKDNLKLWAHNVASIVR
nr:hypothetical protein [Tanacetum cinerariifolium]